MDFVRDKGMWKKPIQGLIKRDLSVRGSKRGEREGARVEGGPAAERGRARARALRGLVLSTLQSVLTLDRTPPLSLSLFQLGPGVVVVVASSY